MVKRVSLRRYAYIAFALLVMISCWESNRNMGTVYASTIPEQAIRLRILANSDTPEDQLVKRQVRDAVMQEMNGWVKEPKGIEAAREVILSHIVELEAVVAQQLQLAGHTYTFHVELGLVPFPTKVYGNQVYPAGDYEALRITLGNGEGQNWWCVLFPPLCFVDGSAGTAVAKSSGDVAVAAAATQQVTQGTAEKQEEQEEQPEVKFFVWEVVKGIGSLFKGLFGAE